MALVPAGRRHRIRNASLALAVFLLAITIPLTITKGNRVVGGNSTLIALWAAAATCLCVWLATTDAVVFRLPSISLQRQGRNRMLVYTPPQKPLRGKRDLRGRAERFATRLLEFLAEWDRTSPFRGHPAWNEGWDKLSDEEKTRRWHEYTKGGTDHFGEQMNRFAVEYSIEALALFDEFRTRGLAKDDERHVFEHPTNTFGIREIAQKLGVWATQL